MTKIRVVKVLIICSILLVLNHLFGWSYNNGKEIKQPINDSVVVAASHHYGNLTFLKLIFLGDNYRKEWSTPVKMPVFHLSSTKGGFTIERIGGGEQTKSLHLVAADGTKWILRSADKDVTNATPPKFRGTIIQKLVQDQISAAYPYCLLAIYRLSKAAGVPATETEVYYVADDPTFKSYKKYFVNTVCFLSVKYPNGDTVLYIDTDSIRARLEEDNHNKILQEQLLKARLFDMLIGDWDRHKNQWKWAALDSTGNKLYYPVPEDRDQAFFHADGIIPGLVRLIGMPQLRGFTKVPDKLGKLNHKVIDFDKYYLDQLNREDWKNIISSFQTSISNDVINEALSNIPKNIFKIHGEKIRKNLQSRRDGLMRYGLEYYALISKKVLVRSTKQPEVFFIVNADDKTEIEVRRLPGNDRIYKRSFLESETKELVVKAGPEDKVSISGKGKIIVHVTP
jgi:hypothetical protein